MNINWDKINKVGLLWGVVLPFYGFLAWGYSYEKSLVKQYQRNDDKMEYKIGIMELKVLSYELKGIDNLSDMDKGRYERAKERLINLEKQLDDEIGTTDN